MLTIIAFLAALTVLIFVHEMGHYLVARWCGVKVLRFSIGFGRPLLSWRRGPDQTEWTIASIPLGGYVRMLDERDPECAPIAPADLPRAFTRKSLLQRSAVVVAGPLANFLLAIVLYAALGWVGVPEPATVVDQPAGGTAAAVAGLQEGDRIVAVDGSDVRSWNELRLRLIGPVIENARTTLDVERAGGRTSLSLDAGGLGPDAAEDDFLRLLGIRLAPADVVIGNVVDGAAAQEDGLRAGDLIRMIDGVPIHRSTQVIEQVQSGAGQRLTFLVLRDGAEITLGVTPRLEQGTGRIGAGLMDQVEMQAVRTGALASVGYGVQQTWEMTAFSLRMLGKMVTGGLSVRHLSGPVTIADLAGQTVRVGWAAYASFLALISISLGVLNLLPIPVLDGGHLVYYALEALRGRPLSERFMAITQKAGLAVIMMMMAVALFNDFTRLIGS